MHATFSTFTQLPLKLAIIGSGPSGFYAASRVLSAFPLSKGNDAGNVEIHMYERLPTPNGLVRYGVAPDHPDVKNVEHKFTEVASDPRFHFFGNVNVLSSSNSNNSSTQQDREHHNTESTSDVFTRYKFPHAAPLPLSELAPYYSHLLFAYGSSLPRPLGIPGSHPGELSNVHSALDFVNWYNGHPAAHDETLLRAAPWRRIELGPMIQHMSIVGAGNVALDVARIVLRASQRMSELLEPSEGSNNSLSSTSSHSRARAAMGETDVPEPVMAALASSRIRRVDVFARRGPAQLAFTNKELREMLQLPGIAFEELAPELISEARGLVDAKEAETKQAVKDGKTVDEGIAGEMRVRKRLLGLLEKGSKAKPSPDVNKSWGLNFFRSPISFNARAEFDNSASNEPSSRPPPLGQVAWNITKLAGTGVVNAPESSSSLPRTATWSPSSDTPSTSSTTNENALATGQTEMTNTDFVVSSVGYRGERLEGDPTQNAPNFHTHQLSSDDIQIPFDNKRGVIPNNNGRVVKSDGSIFPGVYVSGWLARGPVGVIASTMYDAYSVADILLADWKLLQENERFSDVEDAKERPSILSRTQVNQKAPLSGAPSALRHASQPIVSWQDWLRLDAEEIRRGQMLGKAREKVLTVEEMLKITS